MVFTVSDIHSGVYSVRYTVPSPIYIFKNYIITITDQSAEPTVMTPTRVLALKNAEVLGRLLLYLHGLKTRAKLYA